ncbi:MAG: TolC family protein [Ignavibacteriales bacterium]|nr:TolC family protein [Ignavibacteriales bacterium]
MRSFLRFAIAWIMISSLTWAQTSPVGTNELLKLDELITEALRNNPQLRAARNQTAAARTRVDQVTSWDAPQVGVEFFQSPVRSFPNPLKDQMEMDYYIQQMFPFPGKLSAMGKAAEANANMFDQGFRALERKILRELKTAYFELYLVQRKIQINAENQDLMRRFVDIANKQYEVGMGKQPDILRAQTELSTLINAGLNLQKEKRAVEAMINTILSRPANDPLGYVPDIEVTIPLWTFEQLRPLALEARPELKSMNFNIEMNKAEVSLSKREYFPDLMARVMYKDMAMTSNDFWSVMVGVSIPLSPWSSGKYASKVQENELNVKRAEEDFSGMRNMTLFEVQDANVRVQTDQNLVLLYKNTVIPQAEQTLQSTIAAYKTGKTEFLMLIDAYRMVLMARLDYHMSVMNYMASQAALEQAVGLDITEIARRIP